MQVCFYKYLKIENEFIFYQIIVETSRSVLVFFVVISLSANYLQKGFFYGKKYFKR